MPKERVYGGETDQPFEMVVGWTKDLHMQVGISVAEPKHSGAPATLLELLFSDDDLLQRVGDMLQHDVAALRELQETEEFYPTGHPRPTDQRLKDIEIAQCIIGRMDEFLGPYDSSVWWSPTRTGVNNLIRILRKARDAAFGKDE